ncbi:HIRAN domain-containing protein [Nocardia sp. NPDC003979]
MNPPAAPRQPYSLWTTSRGWAAQDVVGTQSYLPNFLGMLGDDFDPRGTETRRTVELVPEPDNPYDRNAVAVRFANQTIGYLPREDAIRYHRPLLELMNRGYIPVAQGRIWAREYSEWDDHGREQRRLSTDVHLYVASPETMFPLNDPPVVPYTMLPEGSAVQVLRTGEHADVLTRFHTDGGERPVIVSLVAVDQASARSTKRVVEVRIDGDRVGQLSPAMSEKYLPAIDHFGARGWVTAARAMLTASAVSATLSLRAQKAHELSGDALTGPPAVVPPRGVSGPVAPSTRSASAVEVQSGVTGNGSKITVRESGTESLITVTIEFARPLTAWQSKVAQKVQATAQQLLAREQLTAPPVTLTNQTFAASAPLAIGQEFVDALIGIDDSDFGAAQEFNQLTEGAL